MAEFPEKELERRLSLYQVFLKLYEHHGSFLDEILQLENVYQSPFTQIKPSYLQGIVDNSVVYVMTNLCENQTQSLRQAQQIWTIGRSNASGIHIADKYLSRRHAAIQYIEHQGFYLIDFNSSNGSYVNSEPVYQPRKLFDGDCIRLGNITFSFFLNDNCRILPTVALELLMQLVPTGDNQVERFSSSFAEEKFLTQHLDRADIFKDLGIIDKLPTHNNILTAQQQSDILDRFFTRQIPDN